MKNFTSILFLVLFAMSSMAQNLVQDPGFEAATLEDWGAWIIQNDVKLDMHPAEGDPNPFVISGNQTVRLTGRTAGNRYISQDIGVESEVTYEVSCKIRISNADGINENGGTAKMRVGYFDGTAYVWEDVATTQSADVVEISGEYVVPSGVDTVRLQFTKDVELLRVDDVVFQKKGGASANITNAINKTKVFASSSKGFTIQSGTTLQSYTVYNIAGQMVASANNIASSLVRVNLNNNAGMYIVKTLTQDGIRETHKVVIK